MTVEDADNGMANPEFMYLNIYLIRKVYIRTRRETASAKIPIIRPESTNDSV